MRICIYIYIYTCALIPIYIYIHIDTIPWTSDTAPPPLALNPGGGGVGVSPFSKQRYKCY